MIGNILQDRNKRCKLLNHVSEGARLRGSVPGLNGLRTASSTGQPAHPFKLWRASLWSAASPEEAAWGTSQALEVRVSPPPPFTYLWSLTGFSLLATVLTFWRGFCLDNVNQPPPRRWRTCYRGYSICFYPPYQHHFPVWERDRSKEY